MSSPVELSDLPVANLALSNDPSAVTLMRVGLTDYQVSVAIIRNINLQALNTLPNGTPLVTDLMLVNRVVSGVASNFQVTFGQVGFPVGTRLWFYNNLPPAPNWTIVPNTGGNLLAAQDSSTTYAGNVTAGNPAGTWQQTDTALTINQIPPHTHTMQASSDTLSGAGSRYYRSGDPTHPRDFYASTSTGGGQGHNHGNTWRPLANVGVIGNKDF